MISVIIPTYKPGAYLWKCLDSLESQTMDKQQYEVIIILNGCRDPYYENIIHHIGKYSMNIHVAQTDVAGVSNARNLKNTCNSSFQPSRKRDSSRFPM